MVYTVQGKLSWGIVSHIHDGAGYHIATLQEQVFTWLPKFEMYLEGDLCGLYPEGILLFSPPFTLDCNGWSVEGAIMEWDYQILDENGALVATVSKELLRLTDTYIIDVANPDHALLALMVVLAIDAEKCSETERREPMAGTLYLTPTPIGNLGDLSQRVRDVLTAADFIAAEDTRCL